MTELRTNDEAVVRAATEGNEEFAAKVREAAEGKACAPDCQGCIDEKRDREGQHTHYWGTSEHPTPTSDHSGRPLSASPKLTVNMDEHPEDWECPACHGPFSAEDVEGATVVCPLCLGDSGQPHSHKPFDCARCGGRGKVPAFASPKPAEGTQEDAPMGHAAAFISELYGILVDPLADGKLSVADACAGIRKAALAAREESSWKERAEKAEAQLEALQPLIATLKAAQVDIELQQEAIKDSMGRLENDLGRNEHGQQ